METGAGEKDKVGPVWQCALSLQVTLIGRNEPHENCVSVFTVCAPTSDARVCRDSYSGHVAFRPLTWSFLLFVLFKAVLLAALRKSKNLLV